ncbi:Serine/threonine-protein phosphatase PP1-like [Heracleum sosnowskyi]|uniref:Serine/threonine-protein phosphatase PP1-like n=1 Tax=Heracleum sosnowskyi TaxID=360622 RepID=A0AAD8LZQ2_9APIA|nr:Serine/threonine-protein phosphatase PP1-like [Heracleum sosnowskyi]
MGSESCGGVGVKDYRSGVVSVNFSSQTDSSASFSRHNEAAWNKMPNGDVCKNSVEKAGKELNFMSTSNSLPLLDLDAKRQRRTSGKAARRSRLSQLESCNETETNDIEGKAKEVGFFYGKGIGLEKTQTSRQKTNMNGKRGDKKNGKALKNRTDSFSVKSGLASFSSAAVGNNILGGYGLRADMEDVTKNVNELSLNELLEGNYKCPNFAVDKGERSEDPIGKIMQSVKDAWSILQTRKIKPQVMEVDGSYHQEILAPSYLALDSLVASRNEGANKDTNIIDASPAHKVQDSGIQFKASAKILDFPLYEPEKVLERLALPPPKDLGFLLVDAAKSGTPRNSADPRSGKPANQRGCLPPFSWSNAYSGHCKSNVDAVKLSTSRSTCQGRWAKIGITFNSPGTTSGFLTELESLQYDNSIVPVECQSLLPVVKEKDRPGSVSFTGQGLITRSADPQASQVRSPRALAAAQLLCDITAHSSKKNGHGVIKSLKRPSQKSMRAPYSKSSEKLETIYATPISKSRIDCPATTPEVEFPFKRPRLSVNDRSTETVHNNIIPRGQLPSWSMPRSNRSSPNKSLRGSVSEIKPYNVVKKPFMLPPGGRAMEPASSSQPKQRKLMRIGWNRESGR